ncbi:MAG TPA: carbohydrate ABC transporter permease [Actinoplanes sp.]|jgi:alpha-glucoside transport system permease protein|nr:carbohydrate ABC transporter permease [Actinoplanes sp.]
MTTVKGPQPTPVQRPVSERRAVGGHRRGVAGVGEKAGSANWAVRIVLIVVCFLWIVPVIGLFITSLREPDAANSSGWWTVFKSPLDVTQWTLSNYNEVLTESNMARAFVNSFAIVLPATIIPILIAAFAAYAFTFMQFPGRDALFILIVSLLVVPNQVALVPLLKIYGQIGLNGTFPAVWLAHIGFGMPLAIYILRNYMATLPKELLESAKIDGASHFISFWRLIVPMSVPALASFAIFQFLWTWNDLLVALIFLGPGENEPLTVNLAGLVGRQGQGWQLITAGGFFTMIVPLLVFLSMQRFFVRGLTAGSVKG